VGFIAHALAVLSKERLGKPIDTEAVLLCALFHDTPEIITGDLPTPIKYYNRQINEAYGQIETKAQEKLIDLLPADLLGTQIYSQKSEEFKVKQGPIFANFVLADEINRAPAKVQSALLEAMQERQITIGEKTFPLDEPFLVLATQNPIEQEGTYPLPEAQTDRFMLKVVIGYPKKEEEMQIIRQNITGEKIKVNAILNTADIIKARQIVREVYLDEKIEKYIVDIVFATRQPEAYGLDNIKPMIQFGGSPRASINLALAARAYAFIHRRGYVIPEDVRAVCYDVLRHRIGLTYEAEANNITTEDIITEVLNAVQVP
jgi:MoxR-like ATPase